MLIGFLKEAGVKGEFARLRSWAATPWGRRMLIGGSLIGAGGVAGIALLDKHRNKRLIPHAREVDPSRQDHPEA